MGHSERAGGWFPAGSYEHWECGDVGGLGKGVFLLWILEQGPWGQLHVWPKLQGVLPL